MQHWNLPGIETPEGSRSPVVLHSDDEARAVLVGLAPGQSLRDHQVKEHAFVAVVEGRIQVDAGGETIDGGVGCLFLFEPDERRAVTTADGAKILLLLAPWPGEGHYRGERPA